MNLPTKLARSHKCTFCSESCGQPLQKDGSVRQGTNDELRAKQLTQTEEWREGVTQVSVCYVTVWFLLWLRSSTLDTGLVLYPMFATPPTLTATVHIVHCFLFLIQELHSSTLTLQLYSYSYSYGTQRSNGTQTNATERRDGSGGSGSWWDDEGEAN